nr:putative nucleotidyltransferase, ribonuclease H [Tanacetum cinerariifolium]
SFLERLTESLGNQAQVQYCLSSPDRQSKRAYYSDTGGHVTFMCTRVDRKCRAPICWDQVGERVIEGPEMIEVTNSKVAIAKEKLKEARTRQKSYADKHRRSLEFQT